MEFRVFVHENAITAVSQQHLLSVNETLAATSDGDLDRSIVQPILRYFDESIRHHFVDIGSYTLDLAVLDDGSVYFIEPNVFGAEYAAGSALFHWIHDAEALHSCKDIELRITDH